MLTAFARVGLLALATSLLSVCAASAMQVPTSAALLLENQITPVTFWAQPYPYKYVPARRCPLARVETPYGWYWDRICAAPGPILRRAY